MLHSGWTYDEVMSTPADILRRYVQKVNEKNDAGPAERRRVEM